MSAVRVTISSNTRQWVRTFTALNASLPQLLPTSIGEAYVARRDVDEKVEAALSLVTALRERRNGLARISRLPNEILAHIFFFLADLDPPKLIKPSRLGWVSTSHVCRRWRTVALNWPALWARLPMDSKQQAWNVFLERAKHAPLSIDCKIFTGPAVYRLSFILEHQQRLQKLCLLKLPYAYLHQTLTRLTQPLAHLRVLSLGSSGNMGHEKLKPEFLSDIAPRLEELSLVDVVFPWGVGSPTLTKLSIVQSLPLRTKPAYTLFDIASTLRLMPALGSLSLINVLPDAPAEIQNTSIEPIPISLTHIRELSLESSTASCWLLWSWMATQAPRTEIQCTSKTNDYPSSIIPLAQAYFDAVPVSFSAASICVTSNPSRALAFQLQSPQPLPSTRTGAYDFARVSLKVPSGDPVGLLQQLLNMTSQEDLTRLELSGNFDNGEAICESLLPMRSVRILSLFSSAAGVALAAMAMPEFGALFPTLQTLHCKAVDFSAIVSCRGGRLSSEEALDQILCNNFQQRVDRLHPRFPNLRKIRIEKCDIEGSWVDEWQGMVREVVWDGDEGACRHRCGCCSSDGYDS